MARRFSFFEEALLVFEAQDQNVEQYRKVLAAIQKVTQCHQIIYDGKKKKKIITTQTSLDSFFKTVDRIESSKKLEPVPSMSGMSEIEACPMSPERESEELWLEVCNFLQEAVIKTILKKRNAKRQKWLSEEALLRKEEN